MSEKQLIEAIWEIARDAVSVAGALRRMEVLLSERIGAAILILRTSKAERSEFSVADFLESREFPFRGVYTERIELDGTNVATLLACFGTWGAPGELLRAATAQIARAIRSLFHKGLPNLPAKAEAL